MAVEEEIPPTGCACSCAWCETGYHCLDTEKGCWMEVSDGAGNG